MSTKFGNRHLIVCHNATEVKRTIEVHSEESITQYCQYHHGHNYGKGFIPSATFKKLFFCNNTPFVYVPEGRICLQCHQGRDQNKKQKEKQQKEKMKKKASDHSYVGTCIGRKRIQTSKKIDCPAIIKVTEIIKFPEFRLDPHMELSICQRKDIKTQIQQAIATEKDIKLERCYHVWLPDKEDHKGHLTNAQTAGFRQSVDPRIREKIRTLAKSGIRRVQDMKMLVDEYVQTTIFPTKEPVPQTRRRYHPTRKDFRNIMATAKDKFKNAVVDQENIRILSENWKQNGDSVFFRPNLNTYTADEQHSSLLFCYQSEWQKRLLLLYGNGMTLLDATYRTCRYSLPLFFLCVRTNVRYIVVGAFIVLSEDASHIAEALNIFKEWNKDYQPKCFMIDFSSAERNALRSVWPDASVRLCEFHREKSWKEWCQKNTHGVTDYQECPHVSVLVNHHIIFEDLRARST